MIDDRLGDRIASLRKYLRISQTLIGKDVFSGKSRQYIANIENNDRIPSEQELKMLAMLFRLPKFDTTFLTDKVKYDKVCNFKLSSELNEIQRRGKEDKFDERELNSFCTEIDEKPAGQIDHSILQLVKQSLPLKFKIQEVSNFLKENLNFEITKENLFLLPEKLKIRLKFTALSTLSGACVKTTNGNYGILINSNQIFSRQRFNLMHELGHFFLGHNEKKAIVGTSLGRNYDSNEVDADSFAAEILMPSDFIEKHVRGIAENYKDPKSIYGLSQKLNVSYSALLIRLKNLELLNTDEAQVLSKVSPSTLTDGKMGKEDPENVEFAKDLINKEIENIDLECLNSPLQLRNFQEGVFSKLREKLSARLAYEEVAAALFKKTFTAIKP